MWPLITVIIIFAFYRLHSRTLEFRYNSKYYFPAYALFYIIMFIQGSISDWLPQLPLKYVFMLLSLAYPLFLYKDRLSKRIFWVFMSYLLYATTEIIVILLFSYCFNTELRSTSVANSLQSVLYFISSFILFVIVELIIHFTNKTHVNIDDFRMKVIFLLGVDIFFILTIVGLFYFNNVFLSLDTAIHIMFGCFITMSTITFFILYQITKKSEEITQNRLQMQQIEMENKLTENLEDVINNLRNLRHDMNNHFGILQGLLEMGEYTEASSYLESILDNLKVANNFVFAENKKLSVLINSKISKSITLNIPIDTEILTNDFPMDDQDLCAVVGNILENAIEACSKAEHPSISFTIEREAGSCIIRCSNTFSVKPVFQNGELKTTKENKEIHGIGTQIIKSIAKKYQGTADFIVDDRFHVTVNIPY